MGPDMLLNQVPAYFKSRRDRLMKSCPGAGFVFPSNPDFIRNSDVHYPFRQESGFYYLSGFEEAESYLVLVPSSSHSGGYKTVLFTLSRDPDKEIWEGERYGIEGAQSVFGADEAYPVGEFESKLPDLLKGCERVFYRVGVHPAQDQFIISILEGLRRSQGRSGKPMVALEDPNGPLGEMRLFKSSDEIATMRKACEISALAHKTVMKETRPGMNEGEIEALIDYQFRKMGCRRLGYPSIVAGGKNATCLHYRSNNEVLRDGDLLLIDAGGEYDYYSSDITRTFPVGARFSTAQAKIYDLVLRSQKEAIDMARPGVTLPAIHKHVCRILVDGLLSLGLLHGNAEDLLKSGEYRRFYPHSTSHWLGMDVHDVGLYTKNGEPRALEAGMVFTIEPGLYVQPSDREVHEEYRTIGIRIEDDIVITSTGCDVLTKDVPKERSEIEALRSKL
jgi:Xaa-Pro aminopeptidase